MSISQTYIDTKSSNKTQNTSDTSNFIIKKKTVALVFCVLKAVDQLLNVHFLQVLNFPQIT